MEETLIRLENLFEDALRAYLDAEGDSKETAYRHYLAAFEALKAFEESEKDGILQRNRFDESNDFLRRHFAWL